MPYTMEDFRKDYAEEHFKYLSAEGKREVLRELTSEEQSEALRGVPAEARLAGFSREEIESYLAQLSSAPPASAEQPKGSRRKDRRPKR